MKKISLAIIALLSIQPFILKAQQWTTTGSGTGAYFSLSGNVGIGTTVPAYKLHVAGTLYLAPGVGNDFILFDHAGTQTWRTRITTDNSSSYIIGNDLGGSAFNNKILTLTMAGNIGIGTTNPSAKFSILGGALAASGAGLSISSYLTTGRLTTGHVNSIHNWFDEESLELSSGSSEKTGIAIEGQSSALGSTIRLFTGGNENVRVLSNGKVGIGTTTPDEKLTVYGKIHSQEVKVDLSVPGPDYVFEPAYKLITLPNLKDFVDKNHHLPEIPTATEMAKNGLDLGDMNIKLLKKVEELTLYLIAADKEKQEQNKKLNVQQNQIDQLKQSLEALSKEIHKN
ncbi:MAG: hypothetical protein V4592_06820 [Bacteroidota bacterium]